MPTFEVELALCGTPRLRVLFEMSRIVVRGARAVRHRVRVRCAFGTRCARVARCPAVPGATRAVRGVPGARCIRVR